MRRFADIGLGRRLFEEVLRHLEAKDLKVARGTIVDAIIISAPSSTKNADKARIDQQSTAGSAMIAASGLLGRRLAPMGRLRPAGLSPRTVKSLSRAETAALLTISDLLSPFRQPGWSPM